MVTVTWLISNLHSSGETTRLDHTLRSKVFPNVFKGEQLPSSLDKGKMSQREVIVNQEPQATFLSTTNRL